VTLRSKLRSLRSQYVFPTVRLAIAAANRRAPHAFRIVHFSAQADHVHLVVEALDKRALSAGMRGLAVRIARRVNRLVFRRGALWADRWHGRALTTPRAVRHAIVYVLNNFRKHHPTNRAPLDPFSSSPYFDDCHGRVDNPEGDEHRGSAGAARRRRGALSGSERRAAVGWGAVR